MVVEVVLLYEKAMQGCGSSKDPWPGGSLCVHVASGMESRERFMPQHWSDRQ